jgi:DNA-3-methyladenine glycosylase II
MAEASPSYMRAALAHLRRADPVMARMIAHVGPYRIARRPERFQALVRAIIFQQLAGAAAQTIYNRFVESFGGQRFPTPAQVLAAPDQALRKVGLSRQKALYIKDLARHVANRSINFHRFRGMDDEEIIVELTRVKGIGRWTAEMFLMFNLWRADVLPVDDLGVRKAAMRAYGMREMPDAKRLRALGERWRPYRSVAVWYLWRSSEVIPPDGSRPEPKP